MSLAEEIVRLRKRVGSHDKLAAKLGTSRVTVIRWEQGTQPSRDYTAKLVRLGVPADAFPATPIRRTELEAEVAELKATIQEQGRAMKALLGRVEALEADAPPARATRARQAKGRAQ